MPDQGNSLNIKIKLFDGNPLLRNLGFASIILGISIPIIIGMLEYNQAFELYLSQYMSGGIWAWQVVQAQAVARSAVIAMLPILIPIALVGIVTGIALLATARKKQD